MNWIKKDLNLWSSRRHKASKMQSYIFQAKKIEKGTFWKLSPWAQEQFLGFGTSSQNSFFILQSTNKALELEENIHFKSAINEWMYKLENYVPDQHCLSRSDSFFTCYSIKISTNVLSRPKLTITMIIKNSQYLLTAVCQTLC